MSQVIEIDENSYYLMSVTNAYIRFYLCKTNKNEVQCTERTDDLIDNRGKTVVLLDGNKKSNGNHVFSWTTDTQVIGIKTM